MGVFYQIDKKEKELQQRQLYHLKVQVSPYGIVNQLPNYACGKGLTLYSIQGKCLVTTNTEDGHRSVTIKST
jgi:hypothetical protein